MSSTLKIHTKTFKQLTRDELYELLQLRSAVFVVEQDCVYHDIDGKDQNALHVIGRKDDNIIAYARCFPPGFYFEEAAIGRVLVSEDYRKSGFAHQIMKASMKGIKIHYATDTIKLSAQQYLVEFYQAHGFKKVGKGYLEDGIPHIGMVKK